MAAITTQQIVAAYKLGNLRIAGAISEAHAISELTDKHGMNRSSANDYIDGLRHMLAGELYTRTLNAAATQHYLENIRKDFGSDVAHLALAAVRKHIPYYEEVSRSQCVTLRKIVAQFETAWSSDEINEAATIFAELESAVAASMALPKDQRRKLLPPPGTKPKSILTKIRIYRRNQHVIAEVLLRANGKCERCGNQAPFKRKTDLSPYLEVHHRQRLADEGDDTVENSEALRPNCHRERHYGAQP